jgi:ABC-type oligopeptide transport system ATPase subunit
MLVEAEHLYKRFMNRHTKRAADACVDVSLVIEHGKTLGLVGESGCGKTTVGRILLRLIDPDSGSVLFDGNDITGLKEKQLRPMRKRFQMIFQESSSAFNPRMKVSDALKESLRLYQNYKPRELWDRAQLLLSRVNLSRGTADNFIGNLSGGELKRLDIARALSIEPEFIVADEPLALLDMSIQSQIANLLLDIQHGKEISLLFISHDLRMVEMLSHSVAVMYMGRILEYARISVIREKPLHPYTRYLWNPQTAGVLAALPEGGCAYRSRCGLYEESGFPMRCSRETPVLIEKEKGHLVACHFA